MQRSSSFGLWLKQRRQALDLSQADLAQRLGCSVTLIQKIEANEQRPSRQIATRMGEVLGIPLGQRAAFVQFARGLSTAAFVEPSSGRQDDSSQRSLLFGFWLKQRRQARDLTQADFADRIGCSVALIQKIEGNVRRPSRQIAARMGEVLGVPAQEQAQFVQFARGSDTGIFSPIAPSAPAAPAWQAARSAAPDVWVPDLRIIGRDEDLATLRKRLLRRDTRVLTIVGPPGIGKTRLALEAAADLASIFPDGCRVVPLAALRHPELVAATVAQSVGAEEARAVSSPLAIADVVADALTGKQMLLVLDNFEHLLGAAPIVERLVDTCPLLKVLVTSRTALHLRHEQTLSLMPLQVPDAPEGASVDYLARFSAVALFVACARAAHPEFQLNDRNARAVATICARLDGLPLAIELAAARVKLLPPPALLARLEGAQGYALLRLAASTSDVASRRHRTLVETIAWSFALLNTSEQRLFTRLGVFAGGCSFAAAEAICVDPRPAPGDHGPHPVPFKVLDVLDGISVLADNHLLRVEHGEDDEPRCAMLETIRAYAREQLATTGEEETLGRRHAEWFVVLAEQAVQYFKGPHEKHWLDAIAREQADIRSALAWLIAHGDGAMAGRMIKALLRFWYLRGHIDEGRRWTEQVLALLGADSGEEQEDPGHISLRAAVLYAAGSLAHDQTDYIAAGQHYDHSLALFQRVADHAGAARTMSNFAMMLYEQGHVDRSAQLFEQSFALAQRIGDKHLISVALNNLGVIAAARGDLVRTEALYREVLAIDRDLGDLEATAGSLHNLASIGYDRRDLAMARAYFEESLALRRRIGSAIGIASSLHGLGLVLLKQGAFGEAFEALRESLRIRQEAGDKRGIATCLEALAELAVTGDPAAESALYAARMLGAAAALRAVTGTAVEPSLRFQYDCMVATTRDRLGSVRFEAALTAGQAMSPDQATAYALDRQAGEAS